MRRFRAPPIEWISERVPGLQDVLEARTGRSALILRELLGPIQLKPAPVDVGRPYYRAVTSIDALALIETPPAGEPAEGGSNSFARGGVSRTTVEPPIHRSVELLDLVGRLSNRRFSESLRRLDA